MRATDFLLEDEDSGDQYANIVTVLSLIQDKVQQGELEPSQQTQFIIRSIRNTGLSTFSYTDLIAANEESPSMANIVKNITPDTVTFVSDNEETATNTPDATHTVDNPQQTVSNMAKSAAKRRQKPLF